MGKVYYSPYGGEIFACFEEGADDDRYRLKALLGDAKTLEIPRDHQLAQHVRDPQQPTDLGRWLVRDGQIVARELAAFPVTAADAVATARADAAAARAETSAVRSEIAALRQLIETRLAMPGPAAPAGGGS